MCIFNLTITKLNKNIVCEYSKKLANDYLNNNMNNDRINKNIVIKLEMYGLNDSFKAMDNVYYLTDEMKNEKNKLLNTRLNFIIGKKKVGHSIMEYFIDDSLFRKLQTYKAYYYDKFNRVDNTNDIYELYNKSDLYKLKLLDSLRVKLGLKKFESPIKTINSKNYNEPININDLEMQEMIKLFDYRAKDELKKERLDLTQFYMSKMKSTLGNEFILSCVKKFTINGKIVQNRIGTFNTDRINKFNKIIQFKSRAYNELITIKNITVN